MVDLFIEYLQAGLYYTISKSALFLLLFLVIIVIPYLFNDWKRVLVIFSVLTLGHLTGTIFSTFDIITPNHKLLSLILMLMILITGLFNVFTAGKKSIQQFKSVLLILTLFFGLCHGMKFSGQIDQWVSGTNSIWFTIIISSLGLFLGQLIFGFITIFISFLSQTIFRFSKRDWIMVISAMVIGSLLPILLQSNFSS
ncbi:MAG: HupE/UreJ family protein [Psychroserpens sp.]|nr:HupE/UreJ family protein [Psychroserpens sp.]